MNTMTNAMTWDAIAANEGNTISEISLTEIDDQLSPCARIVCTKVSKIAFRKTVGRRRGVRRYLNCQSMPNASLPPMIRPTEDLFYAAAFCQPHLTAMPRLDTFSFSG